MSIVYNNRYDRKMKTQFYKFKIDTNTILGYRPRLGTYEEVALLAEARGDAFSD